jgi:TRAP-type C4-dicarboxylate transport system permease small subunit
MQTFLDLIDRVLRVAITALFALLIVPVTLQIVARFVDFVPRYIWTEEVARFCFIWIIMLGAMIAVRDDSHFDVDVLPRPKTAAGLGWARLLVHVVMFALAFCFIWYGKEFADQGLMQSSEIADLPMIAIYIAWPLAGVVWTLFLIEKLVADIRLIRGGDGPHPDGAHPGGADAGPESGEGANVAG